MSRLFSTRRVRGRRGIHRLLLTAVLLGTAALAGCGSDSGDSERLSTAERQRRNADPAAKERLVQAQTAYREGAHGSALDLIDRAENRAPELADVYFVRGLVYSELRRLEEAEAAYRKVVELAPEYEGVYFNLGNVAYRQDDVRDALAYYRKEQRRHPSADVLASIGEAYQRLGRADSARAALTRAVAASDTSAKPHYLLSKLYEEEGSYEQAARQAEAAYELDSARTEHRYQLGAMYARIGRSEEAARLLASITQENPWHYAAHHQLGQVLIRTGRTEEGRSHLARSDSLQDQVKCLQTLQNRAHTNPSDASSWAQYAEALRRFGRTEKALETYQIAAHLAPGNLAIQSNLATLALVNGRTTTAIYRYRQILDRDSTLSQVWFNLGLAYVRNGDESRAREAWSKTVSLDPDHERARALLTRLEE